MRFRGMLGLAIIICVTVPRSDTFAEYAFTTPGKIGTEWGSVPGSMSDYIAKGYRLVFVADVGRFTNYFLQGEKELVRCTQETFSSGLTFFHCAKAISPSAVESK